MFKTAQRLCGVLFLSALTACASSSGTARTAGDSAQGTTARSGSRDLITREDMGQVAGKSAYEVVESLRSNWLRARGRTTLTGRDAEVLVYVNDTRAGGVEQLRAIPSSTVSYIRWYDGNAASGRWGLDHGAGVIYVSTRGDDPTR